jgi:hypothetical protein
LAYEGRGARTRRTRPRIADLGEVIGDHRPEGTIDQADPPPGAAVGFAALALRIQGATGSMIDPNALA